MNEGPISPNDDVVETTDSLEAVGVFRGWKNLFFIVMLLCLLLTQAAFWAVNSGLIKTPGVSEPALEASAADSTGTAGTPAPAAAAADPNQAGQKKAKSGFLARSMGKFDFPHLAHMVAMTNGILLATAILYCLVMSAGLTISLAGRLGGINQISRAVILSLIVLVLLMLQRLLGPAVPGVIWAPEELVRWLAVKSDSTWNVVTFYLRFTLYWVVVVVLLVLAQIRSARWSRAILRRLEIM